MQWQVLDEKTTWELLPDRDDRKCAATDFAKLLGAFVRRMDDSNAGNSWWWLAPANDSSDARIVNTVGDRTYNDPDLLNGAVRPALLFSDIVKICPSVARAAVGKIFESNFEYPQSVVGKNLTQELERNYKSLKKTGRTYTVDSVPPQYEERHYKKEFTPRVLEEVEYKGKKYVRLEAFAYESDYSYVTRDGKDELIKQGDYYFVEVEKVKFRRLKDQSGKEYALADQPLFAGVQFDLQKDYDKQNYDSGDKIDIRKHNLGRYIDKHFSKDIERTIGSHTMANDAQQDEEQTFEPAPGRKRAKQGFGVEVDETPMRTSDQIEFYIKNGMSFMLWGPSGVGKTCRVHEACPNFVPLVLRDGILPEEIIGKTIYPTGRSVLPTLAVEEARKVAEERGLLHEFETLIQGQVLQPGDKEMHMQGQWCPPNWYLELQEHCKKHPETNIPVFIDELTNVKPAVQSFAYFPVLNNSIGPNFGKFPKNSMVVGAGNTKDESEAANNMAEPLFRRFYGHIYLEPNIKDWLEWGGEKKKENPAQTKVHPLVSAFVASHGNEVFYTEYDREEPPKYVLDPRGWTQVSDMIYCNGGKIRNEIISAKIGTENTASFIEFAKNPPLSYHDVLENNYDQHEVPETVDAQYAFVNSCRYVSEKELGKIRQFIKQNFNGDMLSTFEALWVGKDPDRAMLIAQDQGKLSMQIKPTQKPEKGVGHEPR